MAHLVCLDMDRVLVDHLSTWQFVYDKLGISNDESFALYNQGLLDEWDWIKLDLALIKSAPGGNITDERLRNLMEGMPMMKGWKMLIQHLLDQDVHVAIVSGGLQKPLETSLLNSRVKSRGDVAGGASTGTLLSNNPTDVIHVCMSLPTVG